MYASITRAKAMEQDDHGGGQKDQQDGNLLLYTFLLAYSIFIVSLTLLVQWMWTSWMRSEREKEPEDTKKLKDEKEDSEDDQPLTGFAPSKLPDALSGLEFDPTASGSGVVIVAGGSGNTPYQRRGGSGGGPDPQREERQRSPPIYITHTGTKFHLDEECAGLRNAHSVHRARWCPTCQHVPILNSREVYTRGVGHPVHRRFYIPCAGPRTRTLEPCCICVPARWGDIE
eukprot:Skav232889  [mRNA]  locus=scaffold6888:9089:9775:- [translate_table: standard]